MSSRGPDAEGFWSRDGVALGHRRLAILDLDPRANQPMLSSDGRYCLVFNGEIYNFHQLRRELEAQGEVFRTKSDTEVLIALYARYGQQMLPKLRGMFAFAIWDTITREAFLARDPYGIKPLYYVHTRKGVLFASQVKALLASGLVNSCDIEPAGLAGFYLRGSVPEPWTLYRGVKALPAGSCLRIRQGVAERPVCWHDIRAHWRQKQEKVSSLELRERFHRAVTDAIRAHLVADVPVSVFLSGGIDSGSIIGLVSQLGAKVEGITIGFQEFEQQQRDEVPVAASIASCYGFDHYVRRVSRAEFEEDLPRFIDAMDQPTIDGVNSWFACKVAAERGYKVVLSGVGGDKLLYGYSLTRDIPRHTRRNRWIAAIPGVRPLIRAIAVLGTNQFHPKVKGMPEYMGFLGGEYFLRRSLFLPEELPALMGEEEARLGLERLGGFPPGMGVADAVNPEGSVCLLDSTLYLRNQLLRDSDWTSMAHSLELRTPLVDAELTAALSTVHTCFANGAGKRLLAESPANPLPESIINRPKTGFTVPMTEWLRDATGRMSGDHSLLISSPTSPWTRRWATVVLESYIKSDGYEGLQS